MLDGVSKATNTKQGTLSALLQVIVITYTHSHMYRYKDVKRAPILYSSKFKQNYIYT